MRSVSLICALLTVKLLEGTDLRNPWTEFAECGLPFPGYVCDPNRLMDEYDLIQLNAYLRDYFKGTPLEGNSYCNNEDASGTVVSVAIVYDVEDYVSSTGEQAYQDFADQLRDDLWPFGECRSNVYIVFGRHPGYYECMSDVCQKNFFYISLTGSKDGVSLAPYMAGLSYPQVESFKLSTNFVNNMTDDELTQFREDIKNFTRPLLDAFLGTLGEIQPDLTSQVGDLFSDLITIENEGDVSVDFSWSIGEVPPLVASKLLPLASILFIFYFSTAK